MLCLMGVRVCVSLLVLIGWVGLGCTASESLESPALNAGWQARMQQALAEREYRASHNGEGLQAPNRRHDLRTYFEPSGIRVRDRTAAGSPELLWLSLAGVGRGERWSRSRRARW